MEKVTCTAPVNIAVVKYWGKRDEKLILPVNSSISATLDQQQLCAKTTVATSASFTEDRMWLNGNEQTLDVPRIQNVLKEIRRRSRKRRSGSSVDLDKLSWRLHICSENNFPTAAGLASSAAGYACLVYSLAKLYGVGGDISEIARQGSGSACRSVYGGFVEWQMGIQEDGGDSIAHQVAPETHWPEMQILVLVVSADKKAVGSTAGMQTSVDTSELLRHRAAAIVPQRMDQMKEAILNRDFHTFAELTMKDSNQFHAVCLDTYPPISYMTDTSRTIVRIVHAFNKHHGTNKVAYTYDAGPNACLYVLAEDVPALMGTVQHFFPSSQQKGDPYIRGLKVDAEKPSQALLGAIGVPLQPAGSLQYILHTKVGCGPQQLSDTDSLIGPDGLPTSVISS